MIDDVFELAPGDQIVVDGEVLSSDGLAVDESLLTGESDAIDKADGRRRDVRQLRDESAAAWRGRRPSATTRTPPG